jgi:DNA-binding protein YbaB
MVIEKLKNRHRCRRFEADNKEMIEEMLKLAIDEALKNIKLAEDEINTRITAAPKG